jgi:sulfite reductase (ferredoxin)
VSADDVVEVARAVIAVQRDFGDRADRRHARLKYLLADRGIDWFRAVVGSRLSFPLGPPRQLHWDSAEDHLGWHEQGNGLHCYGLFVENGRIKDTDETGLRSALREIVETLRAQIRLTPQQNVLIANMSTEARPVVTEILTRWKVTLSEVRAQRDARLDGVSRVADVRACRCGVRARDAGADP